MSRLAPRFVDRGAITAAYVGIGMAVTVGISFLLIIPIEPIVWLLALPSGLLIGYYANQRSGRHGGPWGRMLVNGLFAGLVTGLTMAELRDGLSESAKHGVVFDHDLLVGRQRLDRVRGVRYHPETAHPVLDPFEFLPRSDSQTPSDFGRERGHDRSALCAGLADEGGHSELDFG